MSDFYIMTPQGADKRGFPTNPKPGEVIYDTESGVYWGWFEEPYSEALGDTEGLGFWGALVGLGSSLLGGLFGGNKAKKQAEELSRTVAEQQKVIDKQEKFIAKQEKEINRAILTKGDVKTYGPLLVIAGLGIWFMMKK